MLSDAGLFLVATLISDFLFGAYADIAITCIGIFVGKFREAQVNWIHLTTFILITILTTTKVILDNVVTVNAFIHPDETGAPKYPSSSSVSILVLNALWIIETMVADVFIIYRVWVVWHKRWIMAVFPSVLLLGCLAAGIFNMYLRSNRGDLDQLEFLRRANASSNAFTSLTLGLNIICTGFISFRIWRVRRQVVASTGETKRPSTTSDPVKRVTTIIVESAAIYTLLLLVLIAFTAAGSHIAFIFVPLVSPTIALVFGSIIVRSATGAAAGQTTTTNEISHTHNTHAGGGVYQLHSTRHTGRDDISSKLGTTGLQVKLDRVVTSKVDGEDSVPYGDIERGSDKYRPEDVRL